VYDQMEREADDVGPADAAARARADEERALLRSGRGDVPAAQLAAVVGAHAANILAVRIWPGRDLLATGSGGLLTGLLGCGAVLRTQLCPHGSTTAAHLFLQRCKACGVATV
jgi:hypothetical protein